MGDWGATSWRASCEVGKLTDWGIYKINIMIRLGVTTKAFTRGQKITKCSQSLIWET